MNDFVFEQAPWEAYLRSCKNGSVISGWKKSSTLSVTRSFFRRWPLIAVLSRATTASPVIFRSTLSPKMAGKESLTVYHIF